MQAWLLQLKLAWPFQFSSVQAMAHEEYSSSSSEDGWPHWTLRSLCKYCSYRPRTPAGFEDGGICCCWCFDCLIPDDADGAPGVPESPAHHWSDYQCAVKDQAQLKAALKSYNMLPMSIRHVYGLAESIADFLCKPVPAKKQWSRFELGYLNYARDVALARFGVVQLQ